MSTPAPKPAPLSPLLPTRRDFAAFFALSGILADAAISLGNLRDAAHSAVAAGDLLLAELDATDEDEA